MLGFLENIDAIPGALMDLIRAREVNFSDVKRAAVFDPAAIDGLVIIGSGTSLNAASTGRRFGESVLNLPISLLYPNQFVNYYNERLLSPRNLYVFISQGGKTKLVFEGLKKARALGLPTLSITEDKSSPVAAVSDLALDLGRDKEPYLYRTTGYSATTLTLYLLYLALAQGRDPGFQEGPYIGELEAVVENLPAVRQAASRWYETHRQALSTRDLFLFSGAGDLYPVAQEADIKFMEMLPIYSRSFELEELMHGPQNAFTARNGFFLLHKAGQDDLKKDQICTFLRQAVGAGVYVVSDAEGGEETLTLPVKGEHFFPLEYVTAFQLLAYELSTVKGRDLTRGIYPDAGSYFPKTLD